MVRQAAAALDAKSPRATLTAAMAKRFATDTCFGVANDALQLLGGYGYLQVGRAGLRDLRGCTAACMEWPACRSCCCYCGMLHSRARNAQQGPNVAHGVVANAAACAIEPREGDQCGMLSTGACAE
jgi:hypothetical protein